MSPSRSNFAGTSKATPWKSPHLWFAVALVCAALTALYSCGSNGYGGGSNPTSPATPRELDSGNIAPGKTYQHRFSAAGTFRYHCIYHGPMTGSVAVSDTAPDTLVQVDIVSSTSAFTGASVKTGGRVVWSNSTSMTHTVTSN